jgi:hypothetical protein
LANKSAGNRATNTLALTPILVYYPCTKTGAKDTYLCFLDVLEKLLSQIPAKNEIIMGADTNANIGKLGNLQSTDSVPPLDPTASQSATHRLKASSLFILSTTSASRTPSSRVNQIAHAAAIAPPAPANQITTCLT